MPAPSGWRRPWAWILLGLLVALFVARWVHGQIAHDLRREPLEVAGRAAVQAHKPIRVLSPSIAERWEADGARVPEQKVRELVGPGNAYLEPIFYWLGSRHGGFMEPIPEGGHCYYFPVQRGADFDADRVRAITSYCYLDGEPGLYGSGMTSVEP